MIGQREEKIMLETKFNSLQKEIPKKSQNKVINNQHNEVINSQLEEKVSKQSDK